MAERTIGLRIELNGFKGVITNIKQLEDELKKAKQDLNELEIGGTLFKQLTTEISRAEGQLMNLKKASEGIGLEKQLEGYGKLAGGITSSFAAAQAAVQLFGVESEAVNEAAAKAQNILTLAMAARGVQEVFVGASIVARTVAEKAATIATNASNVALKGLFATIAANPIGALVAVLGILITTVIALSDAEDENADAAKRAADAQLEYQKAVASSGNQSIATEAKFLSLISLMQSGQITAEEYAAGLKDLGIDLEKLSKLGKNAATATNDYINAQKNLIDANKLLSASEQELGALLDAGDMAGAQNVINRIQRLEKQKVQALATIDRINKQIAKADELEKKSTEQAEKNAQARKQALLEELGILNQLALADLKRFESQQKLAEIQVEFETDKQLQALKQLVKLNEDYVTVSQKLTKLTASNAEADTKRITDAENTITAFGVRLQNLQALLDEGFKRAGVTLQTSDFKKLISEQFQIEQGVINDLDTQFKNFEARAKFQKEFIDQYTKSRIKNSKNVGDVLKKEEEGYRDQAKQLFDTLVQNEKGVLEYQKKVENLRIELSKLTTETDNLKKSQEVLNGFIQENAIDITQQYKIDIGGLEENRKAVIDLDSQIQSKRFDKEKTYQTQITSLEEQLLKQGLDIRKASYEEKLKLLKQFLELEIKETETAEKTKQEKLTKTIDTVNLALQTISKTLTDVASIAAQAFQLQLDKLTYEYEKDMSMIVGQTEEANAKRIELEKIYQAEKRKIEKQAQLTALRFTLAQAVAQGAQAFVNALATLPPPANAIVAGIQAAVTAAQVQIIAQQISFVQSQGMRRGGIMKMSAGGLAQGPSHENGGIYAGGGYTIEGNEAIINRQSTLQYSGLLSQINQSGGGRPITVQSPMDSRLIEALAKQKNEPIRAYVIESDITKAQNINRRLEQLASF